MHQIVYATPPPIHTLRTDVPEDLEDVVAMALQKEPEKRYPQRPGFRRRADARAPEAARQDRRRWSRPSSWRCCAQLKFFHDFSQAEIWRGAARPAPGRTTAPSEEIIREGDMDDRFYVVVSGRLPV